MKTYAKNTLLLAAAVETLAAERPCTLRQLFYRLVSAGYLQNTPGEYQRLGKLMTRAREQGLINRRWIVDHVRATMKPSSWGGTLDYRETVCEVYRRDFWSSLDHYVALFVEKDSIAGTLQPVTYKYDVPLHVCRGYASVSFAGEIADEWRDINKPIFAYYGGDFDPSGFDIERDLREKLARYSGRSIFQNDPIPTCREVSWSRLAVLPTDFADFDLIRLPIKSRDSRATGFIEEHGDGGAEIDALPPSELRQRVFDAIHLHIDQERWQQLELIEAAEKETIRVAMASLGQSEPRSHLGQGGAE